MKYMKAAFVQLSAVVAPLALALAVLTANSTCFFLSYQPDEPANMRQLTAHYKKRNG